MKYPDDGVDKTSIWRSYRNRTPVRVPCTWIANARIFIQDPSLNTEGYSFQQLFEDPEVAVMTQLHYHLYRRTVLNHYSDDPVGLPDRWTIGLDVFNVYEAAYFGAEIDFSAGQVPDTKPPFLDEDRKEDVFDVDITKPLENPFIKRYLAFWHEMEAFCRDLRFEGRPVDLSPWALVGTDGPVTVACNLRGTDFMIDLVGDSEYADRLMNRIVDAAVYRRQAFYDYWGARLPVANGMADDSVAMLSPEMFQERVLSVHKRFYDVMDAAKGEFSMHLCGDATRHYAAIVKELGVTSFDTGFPVDHGALRRVLGPEIEIMGGPEVAILHGGTPDANYQRAREILESGIKEGGRFILRDGNNLPPSCPLENLTAVYQACLDHGGYASVKTE